MKPGPLISKIVPAGGGEQKPTLPNGAEIEIHGARLAAASETAEAPFPATLSGTQVLLNGEPIPLKAVSASRVTALLPAAAGGFVPLKVLTPEGAHTFYLFIDDPPPPGQPGTILVP